MFTFKGNIHQARMIRDSWVKTIDECDRRIDGILPRLAAIEAFIDSFEEGEYAQNIGKKSAVLETLNIGPLTAFGTEG